MPQAASELDLHVGGPGHEAGPRLAPAAVGLLAVMLEDAPLVQAPPPGLARLGRVTPVKSPHTDVQIFQSMIIWIGLHIYVCWMTSKDFNIEKLTLSQPDKIIN